MYQHASSIDIYVIYYMINITDNDSDNAFLLSGLF